MREKEKAVLIQYWYKFVGPLLDTSFPSNCMQNYNHEIYNILTLTEKIKTLIYNKLPEKAKH